MASTGQQTIVTAGDDDQGERLDRFVQTRLPEFSRSRCKELIKQGLVARADGTIEGPNYRVKPGDGFVVTVPEPEPAVPKPEAIALDIAFEDDHLIVVDKPSGMVVHPAAGNWKGTLVNALIAHCGTSLSGIGGVRRPGIVHRLDKDTSGLLVVAKSDAAHQSLARQFAAHGRDGGLERAYLALVWGKPPRAKGSVTAPLGRKTSDRKKIAVTASGGREAITHYEVLKTFADEAGKPLASLVRCTLETGRTHQIRVHMAHIGHPVLGDQSYGQHFAASANRLTDEGRAALAALKRQALHAAVLGFDHPITAEHMRFESTLPADMNRLVTALGGST